MMTRTPPHRDRPHAIRYELQRRPNWEDMPAVEHDATGIRIVGTWPALSPDEAEDLAHLLLALVRPTATDLRDCARGLGLS